MVWWMDVCSMEAIGEPAFEWVHFCCGKGFVMGKSFILEGTWYAYMVCLMLAVVSPVANGARIRKSRKTIFLNLEELQLCGLSYPKF